MKLGVKGVCLSVAVLFVVQRKKCWICGGFMKRYGNTLTSCTKDHVLPRKYMKGKQGPHNNVMLAHRLCNARRGAVKPSPKHKLKARMYHIAAIAYMLAKE